MTKSNKVYGADLNIASETGASVNIPREFIPVMAFRWGMTTVYGILFSISFISAGFRLEQIRESLWGSPGFWQIAFWEAFLILFILLLTSPLIVLSIWIIKILKLKRGVFDAIGWAISPILLAILYADSINMMAMVFYPEWNAYYYKSPTNLPIVLLILPITFAIGGVVYYQKQKKLHTLIDLDEI